MHPIVKICGLSTEETIDAAIDSGADMVGLVFFAKSPRYVGLGRGRELAARAHGRVEVVALTVDMEDAELAVIVGAIEPDWLQLHGNESPARVAAVRARFGRQVMKAVGIATAADMTAATRFADVADRLLLDAKPPAEANRPGGLGRAFDWTLLAGFQSAIPWLLSGGLRPGNVAAALGASRASGVDVSSGVEIAPGVKDPELIRAFVLAAKRFQTAEAVL